MLAGFNERDRIELIEKTPLGRIGRPEDAAELIAFLASEESAFITGQIIGVDGGFSG
jgi:Dehydrogenases with different specificities (related to short-chain alcohol dehydrogenases)